MLQAYPLPPDVAYTLDTLQEHHKLDAGAYLALHLFAPRRPVLDVLDDPPQCEVDGTPARRTFRECTTVALLGIAEATIAELPLPEQGGLAYAAISWLARETASLAECLASWTYEDGTIGGAMKAWIKPPRVRGDGSPGRKFARRLRSPRFIAREIAAYPETAQMRHRARLVLDRADRARGFVRNEYGAHTAALAEQREALRRAAIETVMDKHIAGHHFPKRSHRKAQIERRKRIARSAATATAIVGAAPLRTILAGDPILLRGETLDLLVSSQGDLGRVGPHALAVRALDKSGADLADLCVYVENSPTLDQVAALALAMQCGEEADIIATANIVRSAAAAMSHPLFRQKAETALRARTADAGSWTRIDGRHDRGAQKQHHDDYMERFLPLWRERLAVAVCGPRHKVLIPLMQEAA